MFNCDCFISELIVSMHCSDNLGFSGARKNFCNLRGRRGIRIVTYLGHQTFDTKHFSIKCFKGTPSV